MFTLSLEDNKSPAYLYCIFTKTRMVLKQLIELPGRSFHFFFFLVSFYSFMLVGSAGSSSFILIICSMRSGLFRNTNLIITFVFLSFTTCCELTGEKMLNVIASIGFLLLAL